MHPQADTTTSDPGGVWWLPSRRVLPKNSGSRNSRSRPRSICSTAARPSLHRALPQGSHRVAGRRAAAHARRAADYLRELEARRKVILGSVREQGKLDADAGSRRSWRPTARAASRTSTFPTSPSAARKAEIAKEAGLEPLADLLLREPHNLPADQRGAVRLGRQERRRRGGGARRRARHPGRTLRRECRPDRRAARGILDQRPARFRRCARASKRPAPSSATISTSPKRWRKMPSHRVLALLPRRARGNARPHGRARRSRDSALLRARRRGQRLRAAHHAGLRHLRSGTAGRQVAGRNRALGVAHQDHHRAVDRPAAAPVDGGRGRSGAGVRLQPARPAARRARRRPADARPRSRLPARREGRGGRRHRQGGGDQHDLPARAAAALGRGAGHPRRGWCASTRWSWSRSATAPPRARPTSWRSSC